MLQAKRFGDAVHALGGAVFFVSRVAGQNQLVFHAVLPADQFGCGDAVALRLQIQAAHDVGKVAA